MKKPLEIPALPIFCPLIFLILFTHCSFNKIFLEPQKIPHLTKKVTLKAEGDTTIVLFSGQNHQPTFTKNGRDTVDMGYIIESVVFKSKNGYDLNGWFIKPKGEKATITLMHLHGNAGFLLTQYQAITPLVKSGFQIFMFDYSGFGFSEGKATRDNALIDANSAFDYLMTRQETTDTGIVIYGQSFGGHLAAVLADQRQNEIKGLVIEGGFTSPKGIAASFAGVFGRVLVNQHYSALKSIRDYKKPLLVIHSSEDETVHIKLGKKLFETANPPKEFYEIKGCHICGPHYYLTEISNKIKKMVSDSTRHSER